MTDTTPDFWSGKKVLVTGHTGFKGSWLTLWLAKRGAEVHGLALAPPTNPSLFEVADVGSVMASSTIGDIRDFAVADRAMATARPEIVLHMAAQPLVRQSYKDPIATYATNVMGSVHVLEAARQVGTVRTLVNVTTDKCYENREWVWGYREEEPMGGFDPYSSSKGCAELVTAAYRRSFPETMGIASARAGNVIGGGDWAEDRLVPDILRAFERNAPVVVRNPHAIRPWQHVLEPLSGYLRLAKRLWNDPAAYAEAWNFGPADADARPVEWIVDRMIDRWGEGASWQRDNATHVHEANYLKLDVSKAAARLDWRPRWSLAMTLDQIVAWHKAWLEGADMKNVCLEQIELFARSGDGSIK